MTARGIDSSKRLVAGATVIFIVLALVLEGVLIGYWTAVLEPRLRSEAVSQAQILARSQSNVIAHALLAPQATRVSAVISTLDELLLLRDPASNVPFFQGVEMEVDYDAVDSQSGTLDLRRGDGSSSGFRIEVPLYNPQTSEVIGIAWLRVSERFHQQLSRDMQRELIVVSTSILAVLVLVWGVLVVLLRRLERQTAERARAEQHLSLQEARYHRLVNSLSTYFIYSKDAAGRVTFVSDSVQTVLGLAPAEFIEQHQGSLANSASPAGNGAEHVFHVEIPDDQLTPHQLEVSEVRVADASGAVSGFEGIVRDVTEQLALQEELRHAKEQAEAASRAKSQFLANVSHEIRTPLNAISGIAQIALKTTLPPKIREHLEKIRGSARLLAEIIEDILDLSRIEAGRLEIQRIDFDLDDMLAELSDVVGVRAGQKNIEILFATSPDVPRRLRGDPVRLKQVLLNLLNNAIKFTERGDIVVEITVADSRRELAELKFSVKDTGVGIPAEHLPTLFDAFTQVDASMTRRFGGAGLGLAISRRLVRMMGGDMSVDSQPGAGSTFHFTAAFDVPRGPSGPRRLADEFRDLPVLVADDNAQARIVIGNMLRSLSCRVTSVSSGEEALREFERAASEGKQYRLAVLDWKMPGLDGAETAARLTSAAPLPVILVTAYDREDAVRCAEKAGIDIVLHKPVSPSTLHDAVLRVLVPSYAQAQRPATEIRFAAGQRLLLVEDNPINREVARELLRAAGLEVVEAHNGYQALEKLERESFSVVMMDVQMPELDGLETVGLLRQQARFRDLPVIAMTAHAMLGDRERFLEAGMSDYVAKPIEESELLRVLSRWLVASEEKRAATTAPAAHGLPDALPGLEVAEGLRRASGNADLYQRLVIDLTHENADLPARVEELLARGAHEPLLDLLHTLKGTAGTIGARRLASAAAALESDLKTGAASTSNVSEIRAALEEFRASATRLPIRRASDNGARVPRIAANGELGARMAKLATLLEQNNLSANDAFLELRPLLPEEHSHQVRMIESALDRLEFDEARNHLDVLSDAMSRQADRRGTTASESREQGAT